MGYQGFTMRMNAATTIKAMVGLKPGLKAAAQAIIRFGDVYYSLAEKHYIAERGYLPGSIRTRRLRKKRKKMVLDFFMKDLRQEDFTSVPDMEVKVIGGQDETLELQLTVEEIRGEIMASIGLPPWMLGLTYPTINPKRRRGKRRI